MPYQKRISPVKRRTDPDGFFRVNNELKPLIQRARNLGAGPSIPQIVESNRFVNLNKQNDSWKNVSFFRDFSLCPDLNPTGGPRITFTRASSATRINQAGLIELMAINIPRFDYDPVTKQCKGLLIEEARTNLITRNEEFDNVTWIKVLSRITANSINSPDGTSSADFLNASATGSGIRQLYQIGKTLTATPYVWSFYGKAGTLSWVKLNSFDGVDNRTYFNLTTGAVGLVAAGCSASIVDCGNGWYRCIVVKTANSTANGGLSIEITTGDGVNNPTLTVGDGIYIWGAQLEAGSFTTSYIPTTSATVTRSADLCSVGGNDFLSLYNPIESTVLASFSINGAGSSLSPVFSIDDNAITNEFLFGRNGAGALFWTIDASGVNQGNAGVGSVIFGTRYTGAFAIGFNNAAIVLSGSVLSTDSSLNMPVVDRLKLGNEPQNRFLNGHISKFSVFSRRLVNATLQSLTG